MHTPFLSIITINYNNADGLRKTIESVKNQTSKDYEHIIIDGASTDQSISILKDFLNDENYAKQVSFWCSEKDKGVYDAMNKGIEHATGKYCLFLNSGDYLADNNIVQIFSEHDLGYKIIYTDAIFFNTKKEWNVKYPKNINAHFFYSRKTLSHQNMLFPTSFVKANPYSLEYKIGSDVDMYLTAFFDFGIDFIHFDIPISKFESAIGIGSIQENKEVRSNEWETMLKKHIPKQYVDSMEELNTYENKFHGILRKMKNLLMLYSKIKYSANKGNKK